MSAANGCSSLIRDCICVQAYQFAYLHGHYDKLLFIVAQFIYTDHNHTGILTLSTFGMCA